MTALAQGRPGLRELEYRTVDVEHIGAGWYGIIVGLVPPATAAATAVAAMRGSPGSFVLADAMKATGLDRRLAGALLGASTARATPVRTGPLRSVAVQRPLGYELCHRTLSIRYFEGGPVQIAA